MAGIERLHPHLQHAIVHDLGWRSLRPVQELTIDAILDGCNSVVLAPTAGGKTEAAIFPLLSRILTENLKPVSVLYVCPIRALLNNQEERLQSYARMVGLEVFKWHGDVSDSRKQRFRRGAGARPDDHARVARGHDDQRPHRRARHLRRALGGGHRRGARVRR